MKKSCEWRKTVLTDSTVLVTLGTTYNIHIMLAHHLFLIHISCRIRWIMGCCEWHFIIHLQFLFPTYLSQTNKQRKTNSNTSTSTSFLHLTCQVIPFLIRYHSSPHSFLSNWKTLSWAWVYVANDKGSISNGDGFNVVKSLQLFIFFVNDIIAVIAVIQVVNNSIQLKWTPK